MEFVAAGAAGLGRRSRSEQRWGLGRRRGEVVRNVQLKAGSCEYEAVAGYFAESMLHSRGKLEVVSVERLQNADVCSRYAARGCEEQTLMFHGCTTLANEKSIVAEGFQVGKCVSGGANYGTWLAYTASYSNGGFVYCDERGVRHIFVCVVSDSHIVLENQTMRVVAQDCAYPLWLLRYKWQAPQYRARVRPLRLAPARFFHEVRDGRWVKFPTGDQR